MVYVVGGVPLYKLPHDVGSKGWGDPLSGMNTLKRSWQISALVEDFNHLLGYMVGQWCT